MAEEFEAEPGALVGKYKLSRLLDLFPGSEVWAATDGVRSKVVKLRLMRKAWVWENDMTSAVQREIQIMQELKHPYILKLLEVFNSPTHVFMVMEDVGGRKLSDELDIKGRFGEDKARNLFLQVIQAIRYMHSMGVAHGSITLENLLLSKDGNTIKVTEFGSAARLEEWKSGHALMRQIRLRTEDDQDSEDALEITSYTPPELCGVDVDRCDGRGVDVWSAAVILYAMVTGTMPFEGTDSEGLARAIMSWESSFPSYLSSDIKDLLRGMLRKEPAKRLSVSNVLAHSWSNRSGTSRSPRPHFNSDSLQLLGTPRTVAAAAVDAEEAAEQAASAAKRAALEALEADEKAEQALAAAAHASLAAESVGITPSLKRPGSAEAGRAKQLSWPPPLGSTARQLPPGRSPGYAGAERRSFPQDSWEIFKRHESVRNEGIAATGSSSSVLWRRILLSRHYPGGDESDNEEPVRSLSYSSESVAMRQKYLGLRKFYGGIRGSMGGLEETPRKSVFAGRKIICRPKVDHPKGKVPPRPPSDGGSAGRPGRASSSLFSPGADGPVVSGISPLNTDPSQRARLVAGGTRGGSREDHGTPSARGGVKAWGLGKQAVLASKATTPERDIVTLASGSTSTTMSPVSETDALTDREEGRGQTAFQDDDAPAEFHGLSMTGSGKVATPPEDAADSAPIPLCDPAPIPLSEIVARSTSLTSPVASRPAVEEVAISADTDAEISPAPLRLKKPSARKVSPPRRLRDMGARESIWPDEDGAVGEPQQEAPIAGTLNVDLVISRDRQKLSKVVALGPDGLPERAQSVSVARPVSWTSGKGKANGRAGPGDGEGPAGSGRGGEARSMSCRQPARRRSEPTRRKRLSHGLFRRRRSASGSNGESAHKSSRLPWMVAVAKPQAAHVESRGKASEEGSGPSSGEGCESVDAPRPHNNKRGLKDKLARVFGFRRKTNDTREDRR